MMRSCRPSLFLLLGLTLSTSMSAQTRDGVGILLSKARSLEARGRMDLAAQSWNQVLLVNPNQTEALGGLARYAKETGDSEGERKFLAHLRKINPKDPAIAAVEKMHVLTPQERARLDEAGRLAAEHKPDQAMAIYRDVFGDEPPPGRLAEAFYETEAASSGGRPKAMAQLRALCSRDPGNEIYRLWLARLLTYDANPRQEGFRLLESIRDPGAAEQTRAAWRQALMWEKDNPAIQRSVEAYLQRHPDPELQKIATNLRERQARSTQEANEQHGFQALRNKDISMAEDKFDAVLRRSPNDPNAIAGLGYVRLNQKDFAKALALFERARTLEPKRADFREGYETAKFWFAMQRGAALQADQPGLAIAAYEEALAVNPADVQPTLGIAQVLLTQGRVSEASVRFEQVQSREPDNVEAVAGLGFARLREKKFEDAEKLLERARSLAPDRTDIAEGYRTAAFWELMKQSAAALDESRIDAAVAGYQKALTLDPSAKDALLGLAGAANRKGDSGLVVTTYDRLTKADPDDLRGWLGLVRAKAASNDPPAVIAIISRAPPAARQQLEQQAEYLAYLSLALFNANQVSEGGNALHRALDVATHADTDEALAARLRVASLLLQQGHPDQAIAVYKQASELHPDDAAAWQGLIGTYASLRDFPRAMSAVQSMPRSAHDAASKEPGFLSAIAAVYSADGQCRQAEDLLYRSLALEKAADRAPAEGTQLQLADIWMRRGRYGKAAEVFRTVARLNANSIDAWRGAVTALHNERNDQAAVLEAQQIPPAVQATLDDDEGFLTLLASVQSATGHRDEAVHLFEQARSRYRSHSHTAPAGLDIQLAWAMLAADAPEQGIRDLMSEADAREDLTPEQHRELANLHSAWSLRQADAAIKRQEPVRAIAILTEAVREQPQSATLESALASIYMRQREYEHALDAYKAWGMTGARAEDYRAAAGAALAAHQPLVAQGYLLEGRTHWPTDPELLRMTGREAVSRGQYGDAERYLKLALAGSLTPSSDQDREEHEPQRPLPPVPLSGPACRDEADNSGSVSPTPKLVRMVVRDRNTQAITQESQANQPRATQLVTAEAQSIRDEIDVVAHRNTPFVGVGGPLTIRVGDPGIDRLIVQDGQADASVALGDRVRLGVAAHLVSLQTGAPDGRSGYRLGTLPLGATFLEQTAAGVGGQAQLSTDLFGIAAGFSPKGFLTETWTGGVRLGRPDGPIRLIATRDNVKDSMLSYAAMRDPGTKTVWGGVVSNSISLQLSADVDGSGQYLTASGSLLRGVNVANNWSVDASLGAYWRLARNGQGALTLGLNGTGMHYDRNLSFFSLGHGGYFSPQLFALGSVPLSWFDRRGHVEYGIDASAGLQYFRADAAPFYPLQSFAPRPAYDAQERMGPNYNVSLHLDYRPAARWYVRFYASANNARDYATQTFGITIRLLGQRLPTDTNLRLKSIPDWRGNQPFTF